jgi:glycerophosphoryl diester phosphodiesterase
MDMHVTKDDIVVITHDHYLDPRLCLDSQGRPLNQRILVRSLTFQELQKYDCGSLRHPDFAKQQLVPGTRIPSLDSVFTAIEHSSLARARKVEFNIETKSEEAHPEYTPDPVTFVNLFLSVVKKHKMMSRVMLESFDYRTLKIAHALEPKLRLSVLVNRRPEGTDGLQRLMREIKGQILSPKYVWLTQKDVKDMHKMQVQVLPWTPNETSEWQKLVSEGVDGIITDDPHSLLDWLKTTPSADK